MTVTEIATQYGLSADKLASSLRMNGISADDVASGDKHAVKMAISTARKAAECIAISQRKAAPVQLTTQAKASPKLSCTKCGGSGKIGAFGHINGGTCFQCNGTGVLQRRAA